MKRETTAPRAGSAGVRIIGGTHKRSKIDVLVRDGLRPTPSRVRETLFNWLAPAVPGARVLDCYAGTGTLGMEALSRGAADCTFIEKDPAVGRHLESHLQRFQWTDRATVLSGDVLSQNTALVAAADLIFADPPFHYGLAQAFLTWIRPQVRPDSRVMIECERTETLDLSGFEVLKTLNAGQDCVRLLRAVP